MYPYNNKTRGRPQQSAIFLGPTFSLTASATPVTERPQNQNRQTPDFRLTRDTGAIKSGDLLTNTGQMVGKNYGQFQMPAVERSAVSPYASSIRSQGSNRKVSAPSSYDYDKDEENNARQAHSAGLNNRAKQNPLFLPDDKRNAGDRVIFSENPSYPGVPFVYRTPEERAANPDRLNLDRRKLSVCPILEGEDQLRLLNYQHNMIDKIQHLSNLKRLIFLDLYDNQIEEISGLGALKSLRVLMLGKNKIRHIQGLDQLMKIDVLDLHGNQITYIANINHLTELRVLNLAGNQISHVGNLGGMDSLAELNLRRNKIQAVVDIDVLLSLQRLFLSFNEITSFSDISCIGDSPSLTEISLDGNPFAQEQFYKQTIMRHMQHLRQLDMKRISDEERRIAMVMSKREDDKRKEMTKASVLKEKRRLAINNAKRQWEVMQGSLMNRTSKVVKMPEIYANHVGTYNSYELNGSSHQQYIDDKDDAESLGGSDSGQSPSRPLSANSLHNDSTHSTPRERRRERTNSYNKGYRSRSESRTGGNRISEKDSMTKILMDPDSTNASHLAELQVDTLNLYGSGSLDALDRNWGVKAAGDVTTIKFQFIAWEALIKNLHKIRSRFPNTVNLSFTSNGIDSLHQLNALSSVRRLDSIVIEEEGNAVVNFMLWKPYLIFRLAHFPLHKINGAEVSALDITNAERLFGPLGYISTKLPQSRLLSLLGESKKKQIQALTESRKSPETKSIERGTESVGRAILTYAPAEKKAKSKESPSKLDIAKSFIREKTSEAILLDHKNNRLIEMWPTLFIELIQTAVLEMYDTQTYMKKCTEELEKT